MRSDSRITASEWLEFGSCSEMACCVELVKVAQGDIGLRIITIYGKQACCNSQGVDVDTN